MADTPTLRVGALLTETWELVKAHPVTLLLPFALLGLIGGSGRSRGMYGAPPNMTPANWLAYLPFFALLGIVALAILVLLFLAYVIVSLMTTRAALVATRENRELDFGEQWREIQPLFVPTIGTALLWGLAVVVGLILVIVPGLIVITALLPWVTVVVAEGKTGTDALRRAWDLTKGHRWPLFGSWFLVALAGGIGSAILSPLPIVGGALGGIVNGACLAANVALATLAYEHLRQDPSHHAAVVAQAPMP
ncbi:MAG: hypothetical protein QOE90_562 [Thermoplasmata archaeon]|jgi:hypothetical protein|nr:hypothetical protein [Thermoplasmata archaeon]